MKTKTYLLFVMISICGIIYAQVPQAFKYQAVVRNNSGDILQNQNIGLKVSILQGSTTGTVVYSETHAIQTNEFGLINIEIGNGTLFTGDFAIINWGSDSYFIKTEIDATGGTNYLELGVNQLLSVPYALYSEKSGGNGFWSQNVSNIFTADTIGNVSIGTTKAVNNKLHVIGGSLSVNPVGEQEMHSIGGISIIHGGLTYPNRALMLFPATTAENPSYIIQAATTPSHGKCWWTYGVNSDKTFHINRGNDAISGSDFVMDSLGYVGLGKISPRAKFDVWGGEIYVTGSDFNGSAIMTSFLGNAYFSNNYITNGIAVSPAGNVGIGTANPTYKLSVVGTVRAYEIIVNTGWSDFVFEKDYKLRSLIEVEKFILENKHLPDIPTSKEVDENGVSLGEMNSKLLQKIEELTLYAIDQNKRIETLEQEINQLKNK